MINQMAALRVDINAVAHGKSAILVSGPNGRTETQGSDLVGVWPWLGTPPAAGRQPGTNPYGRNRSTATCSFWYVQEKPLALPFFGSTLLCLVAK